MNPSSTYIYDTEPVLASRNGTPQGSPARASGTPRAEAANEHAQRTDSENYGHIPTRVESIGSLQSGRRWADRFLVTEVEESKSLRVGFDTGAYPHIVPRSQLGKITL